MIKTISIVFCVAVFISFFMFQRVSAPMAENVTPIKQPEMEQDEQKSPEIVYLEARVIYTQEEEKTEPEQNKELTATSLGVFTLTAYCSCYECCNEYALNRPLDENGNQIVYTASGNRAVQGVTIAVDPTVIPYNTNVQINGHTYTAHDTGGLIKGNRIDVYFENHQEACDFGLQTAEVFLIEKTEDD